MIYTLPYNDLSTETSKVVFCTSDPPSEKKLLHSDQLGGAQWKAFKEIRGSGKKVHVIRGGGYFPEGIP